MIPRNYFIFDTETTISPTGDPTAFVPTNEVVMAGIKSSAGHVCCADDVTEVLPLIKGQVMVGHNVAFDLMHLFRACSHITVDRFICDYKLRIWDTQIAEYILTGQQAKMTSLNDLALKYGGTLKDSFVSDAFDRGEGADTIDPDILREYLIGDLDNTDLVYQKQYEQAEKEGLLPLIYLMCNARLCTAIMQFYGMGVNTTALLVYKVDLERKRAMCDLKIKASLEAELLPQLPSGCTFAHEISTSNNMVSAYLYGGSVKLDVLKDSGEVYMSGAKAGKPKLKRTQEWFSFAGRTPTTHPTKVSANYTLIHPLDDNVLEALVIAGGDTGAFASTLIKARRLDKLIGTYCEGVLKNVYPDGRVHPNYNHALTATSRLSCSNPNLQNQDPETKRFFRPLRGSLFVEFDFKQLEVCALAHLSGDRQLIEDIRCGVDLHYETGKTVFGWRSPSEMDDDTRRAVKGVNFGLIYGGTAAGLSDTTGQPKHIVQALIDAFYSRYPYVKIWQNRNISAVHDDRQYNGGVYTELGYPKGHSVLVPAPTGRKYVFHEYDAPEWLRSKGTLTSFSPTEIKNYPVQGFATGDIVPITLAVLMQRWAEHREIHAMPCNTVHDSFMFECVREDIDSLIEMVNNEVIPGVMFVLEDTFGIKLAVPLKVDVKVGPNWGEMKKYEIK